MFSRIFACVALLFAALSLNSAPVLAHEGHDHEANQAPLIASQLPRLEASSDALDLVARVNGSDMIIWLDRKASNEPVTNAVIEVETPQGPVSAAAMPDGTYKLPAPWASRSSQIDLTFTVSDGASVDIIAGSLIGHPSTGESPTRQASAKGTTGLLTPVIGALGLTIGVFTGLTLSRRPSAFALVLIATAIFGLSMLSLFRLGGQDTAEAVKAVIGTMGERPQILAGGAVFLPKATQRLLAVRTTPVSESVINRSVELPGRIIPDPNSSGLVQASTTGRLQQPMGGFPSLGTQVKIGDILAYVATPFLAIDQSTMRQQQGDLDQQIAIFERRLTRYETLIKSNALPQVTLEETRLELQGLHEKRASLDTVKREPEALRAPVDGIVAASNATAGQIADPSTVVFQIVNPHKLFVEALAFEGSARGPASGQLPNGRSLSLGFVGAGFADRNQAVPIHFRIEGSTEGLRLGQFVKVFAQVDEQATGLATPRTALVRDGSGQNIVYVQTGAEQFQAQTVRFEPLDGDRVRIVSGLNTGSRLVTQAAELLNQVR